MAMGYEGLVKLKVDVTEDVVLATGAAVPRTRPRIESSSAYGGQISSPVSEIGIAQPETYDFDVYDGSIDFELHEDFYTNQLKAWIFDRQEQGEVLIQSREGNVQDFDTCFWNSINLTASDGSFVTGSLGFVAIERDTYTIGGDYEANKKGSEIFCTSPSFGVPGPLNPVASKNVSPIPYWNTSVVIDGSLLEFTTWTIDLNQEVVKFFSCENNIDPVEPRFVAVGPMSIVFTGDYMFFDTPSFAIPDTLSTLTLNIGGDELKLEDLELSTANDAVQSPEAMVPIALDYQAYTLVA